MGEEGLSDRWVGLGFISKHEGERGDSGGMVRGGVVLEFGSGQEVWPVLRFVGAENTKIGFNFLVRAFHLSVSLRVVGCGELDVVLEESC